MTLRPIAQADLDAVLAVIRARDIADLGAPDFTLEDLVQERAAADCVTVLAELEGRIVGYGAVRARHSSGVIDPAWEGHGVGGALLDWIEARERERGRRRHRHGLAATNVRGRELLESRGYALDRTYHRMSMSLPATRTGLDRPADAALRAVRPGDAVALHAISEAAFAAAPDFEPETFDAFRVEHLDSHDHDPSLSRVAVVGATIAGFTLARRWEAERTGHVDLLAVAPQFQGRGLGSALLHETFAAFAAAGLTTAELGVASDNPRALRLYERIGMTPRFSIVTYTREIKR